MNSRMKNIGLIIAVVLIAGVIGYLELKKPARLNQNALDVTVSTSTNQSAGKERDPSVLAEKATKYSRAKELTDTQGFINAEAFKLSDLVGKKVILLDFWTYSCINCQRTIPYLKQWHDKYKDKGLVIVGVHTPEFDFEKKYDNVARAVKDAGITYPVVLDSNYGTWNAYQNQYWPREYLIDIDGYVVHDHIGEGGYDETEKLIQNALQERAQVLGEHISDDMPISVPHQDDIAAASPETYFGSGRNQYLGNGRQGTSGEQNFSEPVNISSNTLYLGGLWNIHGEFAESTGQTSILYRYLAKRLYFVAGSANKPIEVEVLIDNKPIDVSLKGSDIFYKDGKSFVKIQENRLYRIIEGTQKTEHTIKFIILESGLQVFTFTFG